MTQKIPHIRVFISSPGDVTQERGIAAQVITNLNFHSDIKGKFFVEPLRWDDPKVTVPLSGVETPQKSVNRYLVKPSQCDLVIVFFWSRIGSPLTIDERDYLSGTHYELFEALEHAEINDGIPEVWVYRRTVAPSLALDVPDRKAHTEQWDAVDDFFRDYTAGNERGYNSYKTPDEFASQLEGQLLAFLKFTTKNPERIQQYTEDSLSFWVGSPFLGLRAYTEDDAQIFFGRGATIDRLVEKMRTNNLVAIAGMSGAGKSSLVCAGLIPRIRDDALSNSSDWVVVKMTVGDDPLAHLVLACKDLSLNVEMLQENPSTLVQALISDPKNLKTMLLVIDQFEEIFTRTSEKDRLSFLKIVRQASSHLKIILTIRAEFYHRLLPHLEDTLIDGQFPLGQPTPFALLEMVKRPAELAGIEFAEGLPERIVTDTGNTAGGLALMAYLLAELYELRLDEKLTIDHYEQVGGVKGAIAKRAETIYKNLPSRSQTIFSQIFRALADINVAGTVTRRRVIIDEFKASLTDNDARIAEDFISSFVEARLLVRGIDFKKREFVEVAHEALLTNWEQVKRQLDKDRSFLIWRRILIGDVDQWVAYNFNPSFLYSGIALAEARKYQEEYPSEVPSEAEPFLAQSQRRHFQRQIVQASFVALLTIISIVAISNFGISQWRVVQARSAMASYDSPQLNNYADEPLEFAAFRIEKEEVNVAEYRLCIEAGICTAPNIDEFATPISAIENDQLPITSVTAYQAYQFCQWIGRRLPTAAEWDYAAQGADQRNFPWADSDFPSPYPANVYHDYDEGLEVFDPDSLVTVNDPNFIDGATDAGVMHMLGNVAEWVGTPIIRGNDDVVREDEVTGNSVSYCESGCLNQWDGETPNLLPVRGRAWQNYDLTLDELSIATSYISQTQPNRVSESIGFRCASDGS